LDNHCDFVIEKTMIQMTLFDCIDTSMGKIITWPCLLAPRGPFW